jgi:hypothetical protein
VTGPPIGATSEPTYKNIKTKKVAFLLIFYDNNILAIVKQRMKKGG